MDNTGIVKKALPRRQGFSMVELLIAMLLGVFVLGALIEVLLSGKSSFNAADKLSRLQESGRITSMLLSDDLKRAGYMGGNSDIPKIFGTVGKSTVAVNCPTTGTSWGRMVSQPVVGLNDTNAGYACVPNTSYLRGDILTVRYASPWVVNTFSAGSLYLRSSIFEGKIFSGAEQAQAANVVLDQPQSVHELVAHSYFVGKSGRSCNGAPVPSLFRVSLDPNGLPVVNELLPGVERFQVKYGIGGQYQDADVVADWAQIVAVKFWLLIRSSCSETGFVDNKTYILGTQNYTPGDGFRRLLVSRTIMLRN